MRKARVRGGPRKHLQNQKNDRRASSQTFRLQILGVGSSDLSGRTQWNQRFTSISQVSAGSLIPTRVHNWAHIMSVWRRPRAHPLAASGAFARQRWANYVVCDGTPAQVLPADEAALLLLGSSVAPSSRPEASHTRGRSPPPFPRNSRVSWHTVLAVPHLAQSSEHFHVFSPPRLSVRMFGSDGKKRANASSNCAAL